MQFRILIVLAVALAAYLAWPRAQAGQQAKGFKAVDRFAQPVKVRVGDSWLDHIGYDVWAPNPFLASHDEAKREGRLAIPIDGMELFEHGYHDGGDMDKSENEQYIAASGLHGADWHGVVDLWSPEGMRDNWSAPKSTNSALVHDPARAGRSEGRVEHGFTFANPVLHSLFDLVIQENPIFAEFSPTSNAIDGRRFQAPIYDLGDYDSDDEDDDYDELPLGELLEGA